MGLHRLPRPIRMAAYAVAVCVLLYLCLAPTKRLPKVALWDKAEHAIAWFVLAALGYLLAPRRPRAITAFALGLGAAVEILQWLLPFGRDADVRDWLADAVGVAAALLAYLVARRRAVGRAAA